MTQKKNNSKNNILLKDFTENSEKMKKKIVKNFNMGTFIVAMMEEFRINRMRKAIDEMNGENWYSD
jgi:hypothetical protein